MRRDGFTLVELVMVIVVAGLILIIGVPRMNSAVVDSNIRGARNSVHNMLAQARAGATEYGRATAVRFNGNQAYVTVATGQLVNPLDTLGEVRNLNREFGVTVGASAALVSYDPRGFGLNGGNVTLTFTRSGHADTLVVSSFGRVLQ